MLPTQGKQLQRPEHSSDLLHRAVTPKGMRTPRPFKCPLCSSKFYQQIADHASEELLIMHLTAPVGGCCRAHPGAGRLARHGCRRPCEGAACPIKLLFQTPLADGAWRKGFVSVMLSIVPSIVNRTSLRAARVGRSAPSALRRLHTSWPQVQLSTACLRWLMKRSYCDTNACDAARMPLAACYSGCAGSAGEQRLFSEQQLMDCSWGHTHNKACDGGLYEGAYHYLTRGDGVPLALESDYPCESEARGLQACCMRAQKCRLKYAFTGAAPPLRSVSARSMLCRVCIICCRSWPGQLLPGQPDGGGQQPRAL